MTTARRTGDARHAELVEKISVLESENAALRERAGAGSAVLRGRGTRRTRAFGAIAVVVIAAVLAPLAVTAMWVRGLVTDTDWYVETVAPLADDPAVQAAITAQITNALLERIDPQEVAGQATAAVADLDLPPTVATAVLALRTPLAEAISSFVRKGTEQVVESDAFRSAWVEANRTAHDQLVAVLSGEPDAIAELDSGGNLSINLASVIAVVTGRLSDQGFTLVDRLPTVNASFELLSNGDMVRLRQVYRLIEVLGPVLIWGTLGLLALGVALSVNRPRALMVGGFVLAGAATVVGGVITVGRALYTDALVGQVDRADAGLVVYDQVLSGLRMSVRATLALGLVLVVIGFLIGSSSAAQGLRAVVGRNGDVQGPGWLAGVRRSSVARQIAAHRSLFEGSVAVLAGVVLVAAERLSAAFIVSVALVVLVVVLVERFCAPEAIAEGEGPADGDLGARSDEQDVLS